MNETAANGGSEPAQSAETTGRKEGNDQMPTYTGTIVGGIWWPYGATCALDVPPFDAEDDEEAVDVLFTLKSGDFSSVMDVECWRIDEEHRSGESGRIIETRKRSTLVKAFSEEAECAYSDCFAESE